MANSDKATLKRDLGLKIATAMVVGNVIGSGIYAKPGNIASVGGNFSLIISVWVLGGVLCFLGALCFAELSTMSPEAGGLYVYLRNAYGKPVAFLFGWTEIIFGKPASIGALSMIFIGSLAKAAGWSLLPFVEVLLAAVLIAGLAAINIAGVLWGGRMQLATTLIKASFLALVALMPFVLLPFASDGFNAAHYTTTVTPATSGLAAQVGAVLLAVMWAYNGWHGITPLAEEVSNPQRNIPLALFGGIGILILLYVSANVAYHGVLTMSEMKAEGEGVAEAMLRRLLGKPGLVAMSAVIMCSTFGAINSNLLGGPRVSFAMGRDQVFFRSLGQVHATFRTPVAAIVLMAGMSITLVVAVAFAKEWAQGISTEAYQSELAEKVVTSLQDNSIFDLLTNFVIFSASIFYMLGVAAVIVLRERMPEAERPYRTWGYPLTPIAFLVVYLWFLSQVYGSHPLESRTGLLLILVGLPVYLGYRTWDKSRRERTVSD